MQAGRSWRWGLAMGTAQTRRVPALAPALMVQPVEGAARPLGLARHSTTLPHSHWLYGSHFSQGDPAGPSATPHLQVTESFDHTLIVTFDSRPLSRSWVDAPSSRASVAYARVD